METRKKISIVVPCFNEEEGLDKFNEILTKSLPENYRYEIIYINDGSSDNTLNVIQLLIVNNPEIRYISFSRNFGHQNALKAGYDFATGNCAVSLDADLQHPPEIIAELIQKWEEGYEIVNTIRLDHQSISAGKKVSSGIFYKLMRRLSDVNIENGMADFRLVDRKVLEQLKNFTENHLFFRGIIPWMGFRQVNVTFRAKERFAGTTKYTLKKMIKFAITGVTAFSVKPLRISIYLGLVIALLAFIYAIYITYVYLFTDQAVTGWTSVILSILAVGGINLIMLGIIGEYLGKLFIENKRRPNYLISETNIKI